MRGAGRVKGLIKGKFSLFQVLRGPEGIVCPELSVRVMVE